MSKKGCPLCTPDYSPTKAMKKAMDKGTIYVFDCNIAGRVGYLYNRSIYTDAEVVAALSVEPETARREYVH